MKESLDLPDNLHRLSLYMVERRAMVVDISTRALTVGGVARLLRVRRNTIRQWSDMGLIQSSRVGSRGDRLFLWEDIDKFLRESLMKP